MFTFKVEGENPEEVIVIVFDSLELSGFTGWEGSEFSELGVIPDDELEPLLELKLPNKTNPPTNKIIARTTIIIKTPLFI